MKYSENPAADFRIERKIETDDPTEFVAFLASVPAEAPVAWYSHKDEGAHPGVWVRRGNYRLKHGSFVDPSDLSAYAAQYYEPFNSGRHEAVQIGRTPVSMAMPEDVTPAATVAALIEAIQALTPEIAPAAAADEEAAEGEAADGQIVEVTQETAASEEAQETVDGADAPIKTSAELVAELKFLQPDYAFEFHGALTRGWHAQLYAAEPAEENAVPECLLVLR